AGRRRRPGRLRLPPLPGPAAAGARAPGPAPPAPARARGRRAGSNRVDQRGARAAQPGRVYHPRIAPMFDDPLLLRTRRHFFRDCALGLGSVALASLLNEGRASASAPLADPLAPKQGHFPARAKSVIFLFMAGGPSQLDPFDYKPKLNALHGKPIPDEFIKGKRFAFMDTFAKKVPQLLATRRKFARHGQAATWVSEC